MIPFYALVELFLFSWIYVKYLLKPHSKLLMVFLAAIHMLILAEIIFSPWLYTRNGFFSISKPIANFSITLLCLIKYYQIVTTQKKKENQNLALNAIVLTFFSINLLIFLSINFLITNNPTIVGYFWFFNLITVILFYISLIILLWQNGRTRFSLR